jgi:hypothetical protein
MHMITCDNEKIFVDNLNVENILNLKHILPSHVTENMKENFKVKKNSIEDFSKSIKVVW